MSKMLLFLAIPAMAVFSVTFAEGESEPLTFWGVVIPLVVIIILVLLNGVFVAAEFAMIGSRKSQLRQLADEGNTVAAKVYAVRADNKRQDNYIATAQLGITIATLGLGMYGEPRVAEMIEPSLIQILGFAPEALAHSIASFLVVAFMTYLHVVVGEMVPKSMALTDPVNTAIGINRFMQLVEQIVLRYPVRLLNWIGRSILRLVGIESAEGHSRAHSPEELELIVSESADSGLLNQEEEELIRNIFDFSERMVGQVMTPRPKVQAISLDINHDDLVALVVESTHSRFPVYEGDRDHIIGILHLKDLIREELKAPGQADIKELLNPAPAVPEDQPVAQLLAVFKRLRIHMAVVLDEFGGMAGIVTLEDLVEEIVGEVRDEFDTEREPYVKLGRGLIEVSGSYLKEDLSEQLYLGEENEIPDVETVGGLVVTALGRPPMVGDEVLYGDVKVSVTAVEGLAVNRVRITYPEPMHNEEE